jgi:hypothetical protein
MQECAAMTSSAPQGSVSAAPPWSDHVVRLMVLACLAAAIWPVFAARDLPLTDLPNHLAAVSIWRYYHDPRFGFEQVYELNTPPVPYYLHYGLVYALSWIMPLRWASKAFLVITALALPAGLGAYLKAHRRPAVLAVAACPLVWTYCMAFGFLSYLLGVALFLVALALAARLADARPWASPWLVAGNVLVGFALYFSHPLPFLMWGAALVYLLRGRAFAIVAPSALLFLWQFGAAAGQGLHVNAAPEVRMIFSPNGDDWAGFSKRFLFVFSSDAQRTLLHAGLLAAGALAALLTVRVPEAPDRRPLVLFAAMVAAYFVLPNRILQPIVWENVSFRLALSVALLAVACLAQGQLRGVRAIVVLAPIVVVSVIYAAQLSKSFRGFDRRVAGFYELMAQVPRDESLLTVVMNGRDPAQPYFPLSQMHAYQQIERGGVDPWAWNNNFPMRLKATVRLPGYPPAGHMFEYDRHGGWAYILTFGAGPTTLAGKPGVTLVDERGRWQLWRTPRAKAPAPAQ